MTEPFEHLIRSTLTDLAEEAPIVHDQLSQAEQRVRNRRRATVTMGAVGTRGDPDRHSDRPRRDQLRQSRTGSAQPGRPGRRTQPARAHAVRARPARADAVRARPARADAVRVRPARTRRPGPRPVREAGSARRTSCLADSVDPAPRARQAGAPIASPSPPSPLGAPGVPARPTVVPSPSR
ncbi:hypothetical protein NKG94_41730 [Micromonospora sp. M12]